MFIQKDYKLDYIPFRSCSEKSINSRSNDVTANGKFDKSQPSLHPILRLITLCSKISYTCRVQHKENFILARLASDFHFILARADSYSPNWRGTFICTRQSKFYANKRNTILHIIYYKETPHLSSFRNGIRSLYKVID